MDKNPFTDREKYYPILIKNKIKHGNNRKIQNSDIKSSKKIEKMINFLSDKKEKNSFTFFKTFIGNSEDISNNIFNKKLIKVDIDNKSKSKSKNKIYNSSYINNKAKKSNQKINSKFNINIKDSETSMNQKINKFESRIDNLLNVINDFENKFIYSPETQKIKEELNNIINKKIYQDKVENNYLCKSYKKNEIKNTIDIINNNTERKGRNDNYIMDINNIDININNNYKSNYYLNNSINDISHNIINKKINFNEKKKNKNLNMTKKSKIKSNKNISKCNSNDLKNKSHQNCEKKKNFYKLPSESINNKSSLINNTIKNNRYNNLNKEFLIPLTERKERDIENNKNYEINFLRNSLKKINKNKNNFIRINKAASSKKKIKRKTFIKNDSNKKLNSFKKRKKLIEKNLISSLPYENTYINNTINGRLIKSHGIDISNKNKKKEKSINGSAEFSKMRKKDSSDLINYILNKRNILKKKSIISSGNIQYNNKDFNYNKKILKKK